MKTTFKAAIAVVLTVVLALLMRHAYQINMGNEPSSSATNAMQDALIEAKDMFLEKSVPIQKVLFTLSGMKRFSLLAGADGTAYVETPSGPIALEHLTARRSADFVSGILHGYFNEGQIYNIQVTPESVLFFTKYIPAGCAGFLYQKIADDNVNYYELIDLAAPWALFHRMDDAQ
jgi:hypothetical protein